MTVTLPLVLIAVGSATLVALRNPRLTLAALAVQWLGLILSMGNMALRPAAVLGVSVPVASEVVTALVCTTVLAYTLRALGELATGSSNGRRDFRADFGLRSAGSHASRQGLSDAALLWAVVLAGGVAGYGLAAVYPLGTGTQEMLGFYWVMLSAILALVLEGTRDAVKLTAGLLAFVNGTALLIYVLSLDAQGVIFPALLALLRIGIALLMVYVWSLLISLVGKLSMPLLFDARASRRPAETALVVFEPQPVPEAAAEETEPAPDAEETDAR